MNRQEDPQASALEITVVEKKAGALTKKLKLENGTVIADSTQCRLSQGQAMRLPLPGGLADLQSLINELPDNQAILCGRLHGDLEDEVPLVTKAALQGDRAPAGAIARTRDAIDYAAGKPAIMLLDFDRKDMPPHIAERIEQCGGFYAALVEAIPELRDVARLSRASTSAGLENSDTDETLPGSGGEHHYIEVLDGADIERVLQAIHAQLWLADLGWYVIGSAGQVLERSIVDRSVWAPERLVFEAPPVLVPPLKQDASQRKAEFHHGSPLNTRMIVNLSESELRTLSHKQRIARQAIDVEAKRVRSQHDQRYADRLMDQTGQSKELCLRLARLRREGILTADVVLEFDDPDLEGTRVGAILEDPERFSKMTLADPLEGVPYGRCKAMIMLGDDGWPFIHSFAHGGALYRLRHDVRSFRSFLEQRDSNGIVEAFVHNVEHAVLEADEREAIIDLVAERSGRTKQAIKRRLKDHQNTRRRESAGTHSRQIADSRIRLAAPDRDGELTPVLRQIDEVLVEIGAEDPPMRNAAGELVEVHAMEPTALMQSIQSTTAAAGTLAASPELRLDSLDASRTILLIERYIELVRQTDNGERIVRLDHPFANAFRDWRESRLPRVNAIVTAPLVTETGGILKGSGLDRDSGIYYRIVPTLLDVLPDPATVGDTQALSAFRFLTEDWLVDVAADVAGKTVAIAYALSLIQRVLLPERPAFFFTASQRGGGKTTLVNMLAAAVLGHTPSATAWTHDSEERRKGLMAIFQSGTATIVWDNIARGEAISCPRLEAILTAPSYSDRILGATRTESVSCQTVIAFTGNNIVPKGDMASRSLICRLQADRLDPENREFVHPDPIGWTLARRLKILEALYTLLIWRPREKLEEPPTRFKSWWKHIGRPLEAVTALLNEPVAFSQLFAANEEDDEVADGVSRFYEIVRETFGDREFTARDLVALLEGYPEMDSSDPFAGDENPSRAEKFRAALMDATEKSFADHHKITGHAIGKLLQKLIDRPGDTSKGPVRLRSIRDRRTGNRYRLERLPDA